MQQKVQELFNAKFQDAPLIVRSPGRVNVIGEHTDYNEGFVLPAAVDKYIYVGISKRTDQTCVLHAVDFDETLSFQLDQLQPQTNWTTYILGVANQVIERGHYLTGFNLLIDGDIPIGAGMSSSAAVECAVVFALNELFQLGLSKMDMVLIAQKAEHTFAGVQCGIMDMFASMFGKQNQVIRLDCRSLEYQYAPLDLQDYQIVLFNTNVKHSLASSAYNTRRQQCEQGVAWVQAHHPEVKSLRDVNEQMLQDWVAPKDDVVFKRCLFIVQENQRLLDACKAMELNDWPTLGTLLFGSHKGLSEQYEVSCKELDFLVDAVSNHPAVLGARMMGGGFGGCTINLIQRSQVDQLYQTLRQQYQAATGLDLTMYSAVTADGTSRMN